MTNVYTITIVTASATISTSTNLASHQQQQQQQQQTTGWATSTPTPVPDQKSRSSSTAPVIVATVPTNKTDRKRKENVRFTLSSFVFSAAYFVRTRPIRVYVTDADGKRRDKLRNYRLVGEGGRRRFYRLTFRVRLGSRTFARINSDRTRSLDGRKNRENPTAN